MSAGLNVKRSSQRFRLNPPHDDRIHWVAEAPIPGDSRTEHISVDRGWFWRGTEAGS